MTEHEVEAAMVEPLYRKCPSCGGSRLAVDPLAPQGCARCDGAGYVEAPPPPDPEAVRRAIDELITTSSAHGYKVARLGDQKVRDRRPDARAELERVIGIADEE